MISEVDSSLTAATLQFVLLSLIFCSLIEAQKIGKQ